MRVALFRDDTPLGHRVAAWFAASGATIASVVPSDIDPGPGVEAPTYRPARSADLAGLVESLSAFQPDLLVVATFPWKLPSELVRVAPRAFNLHSALLPDLRGAHPEFWSIRRGLTRTGVTAHMLTEIFDAGPVYAQRVVEVGADETLGTLCERLADAAIEVVRDLVDRADWVATVQDGIVSSAPLVTDADLRLNPLEDGVTVLRHWRACTPYLVPWLDAGGRRLPVASLSPVHDRGAGPVGVWFDRGFWYVRCADQRVFEVVVAGGAAHG